MRQILILFLLLPKMTVATDKKTNSHLEKLNAAYPFGLLTDDYGILSIDDLKIKTNAIYGNGLTKIIALVNESQ